MCLIKITNGSEFIQFIHKDAWIWQAKDDEHFELLDGRKTIEESISDWNLNQQCKGSKFRAEIVSS